MNSKITDFKIPSLSFVRLSLTQRALGPDAANAEDHAHRAGFQAPATLSYTQKHVTFSLTAPPLPPQLKVNLTELDCNSHIQY